MSPPSLKKNTYFLRSGTPLPSTTTSTSTSTSTTPAAKEDPTPPSPPDVPRRHSVAPSIERWMQHVFASPSSTSSTSSTTQHQRIHNPLDPRYLGNIPFSYTTDKLRQWGAVYLNNTATADAFVRAIPLPLPPPPPLLQKRIVRVRVCGPHRMFYMQKAFPRVGARCASRPLLQPYKRRLPVPMHIEYALYRTPLLAAVLLCEHVQRGDTVDIPLPFPEAWGEVVEWMYTGAPGAEVSQQVRETVEYLGGKI